MNSNLVLNPYNRNGEKNNYITLHTCTPLDIDPCNCEHISDDRVLMFSPRFCYSLGYIISCSCLCFNVCSCSMVLDGFRKCAGFLEGPGMNWKVWRNLGPCSKISIRVCCFFSRQDLQVTLARSDPSTRPQMRKSVHDQETIMIWPPRAVALSTLLGFSSRF